MKKTIIAALILATGGSVHADIYASPVVYYGIGGNGSSGGIVDPVPGTTIVMQIIDGGGDGLNYSTPGIVEYNGGFLLAGNDRMIGTLNAVVSANASEDFSDYGTHLSGTIGGYGTAWSADTWVRVSGIRRGDWVYESAVSFMDADYSDPKTLPEKVFVDNGGAEGRADGSVRVNIPEPSSALLLMTGAGGIIFYRRAKQRQQEQHVNRRTLARL